MKKMVGLMASFTLLFAIIFYEAQVSFKVGKVYEVPLQTNDLFLSEMNINVDEERIESKAEEVLGYLFGNQFDEENYEVSVDTIRGYNNISCYYVCFYDRATQLESYTIEFEIESGDIVYIWNNEFQYTEDISDKEQISEEKLEQVAKSYLKMISTDEVNHFKLVQKKYLMTGIQFIYSNDKDSQEVSISLDPKTGAFIGYLRDPYV